MKAGKKPRRNIEIIPRIGKNVKKVSENSIDPLPFVYCIRRVGED